MAFVLILLVLLIPQDAHAHAAERGLILLLPTEYYLWGGGAAVAVSFLSLAFGLGAWSWGAEIKIRVSSTGLAGTIAGWGGLAAFAGLVLAGMLGTRDPLSNPLPLMVWTVVWVGFVAMAALLGNFWTVLNPWRALSSLAGGWNSDNVRGGANPGYWPAITSLAAISWFEIVDIAPDDPSRLARAVLIYWGVHLAACFWAGTGWLARGEALSAVLGLIARMAPLYWRRGLVLRWPGGGLIHGAPLPLSGWLFVCLMIATVTFDGMSGTFWWLGLIGVNPLEFPGRSAVLGVNSAGLVATWLAMSAAFAGTVALGWQMAGRVAPLRESLGRIALSLLPIALAYHLSHYLTVFLVNGQYALAAVSDPFGTGADWLGLGAYPVTTSFLNNLEDVQLIWRVQVGLIVGGHVMAVLVAHAIALRLCPDRRAAVLSQVPLAILMVAYTVLGLWLLSAPTAV